MSDLDKGFRVVENYGQRYDIVDGKDVVEGDILEIRWPASFNEVRRIHLAHEEIVDHGRDEFSTDVHHDDARAYFNFWYHGCEFRVYLREIANKGARFSRPSAADLPHIIKHLVGT
jgi:hypothetical protein